MMSRSTDGYTYTPPQPPEPPEPPERTVRVKILQLDGTDRTSLYRDEIFDVEITVTGEPAYTGTMRLILIADTKHKTLVSRGRVQMYDFASGAANPLCANDTSIRTVTFAPGDNGVKRFKAVVNHEQTIQIRVAEINENGVENKEISAVTPATSIDYRLRQYTTHYGNGTVNDYDENINTWVDYWDDWNLGNPAYTFINGAIPHPELVKAVAYNESTLYPRDRITNVENLDLMHVTEVALNGMTIQPKKTKTEDLHTENDVNATGLGDPDAEGRYTGTGANMQLMNYGTLNEGHTVQEYTVANGPTDATVDDSFQWGIRWLISKYTRIPEINGDVVTIRALGWWGDHGALSRYGPSNDDTYADDIRRLYEEGRNPNPGDPDYLWPIKADGCPRQ